MRLMFYGGVSTLLAVSSVLAALRQRANFYAASVYLSKSNACMMILCNFGIFCTVILSKILQSIFFGKLRSIEVERLHDRLWFTVTETLLALAMFRDEFDTTFVVLFISLIFVKCFHWLASDRVEWMDQSPEPPGRLFHARMISVLSLIWFTDLILIAYATESVLLHGPSVVLMFEMEYVIMQVTCLSIICKYTLNSYGQYRAQEHWEEKSTYLFYIELATDFLKLLTYIGFLSLTVTFYGLPINVLRDVYYTARSFISKCNNLMRFRQATRNMNERYPNATREEMESLADKTCIICREDMEFREDLPRQPVRPRPGSGEAASASGPNDTPKKLPCGHIFHFHCLRSWLERQQSCPTCRRPVLQPTPAPTRTTAPGAIPPATGAGAAALIGQNPAQPNPQLATGEGSNSNQAAIGSSSAGTQSQTRLEIQQRLREIQQRLASNASASTNSFSAHRSGPSSQPGQGVSSSLPSNPLASFSISEPSSSINQKSPQRTWTSQSSSVVPELPVLGLRRENNVTLPPSSLNQGKNDQLAPEESELTDQAKLNATSKISVDQSTQAFTPATALDSSKLVSVEQPGLTPSLTLDSNRPVASFLSPENHPFIGLGATPLVDLLPSQNNSFPSQPAVSSPLNSGSELTDKSKIGTSNFTEAHLPTLANVQVPCLIPLFDTESYKVPSCLKGSIDFNRRGRAPIDKSAITIPTHPFEASEYKELVRSSVEEQLKVLMNVQETLMSCCDQLRNSLSVKECD
ncbi:expressed protein, partial [Phakopsora pachyrhizi]